MDNQTLWYKQPANNWNEALPLGNGRLGAMVFGNVTNERFQLNEDSVWSGKHIDRINPDSYKNLAEIRRLIFAGRIREAEKLSLYALSGTPEGERMYQTLGDLHMTFEGLGEVSEYTRELDLKSAVSRVRFKANGAFHTREAFISNPDEVMVINITAGEGSFLNFACRLDRRRYLDNAWAENGNTIAIDGGNGISFCSMLRAKAEGGEIKTIGEHLIITGAKTVTLLYTAATSFRYENFKGKCRELLSAAEAKSYEELKAVHIKDYKSFFDRVELKFSDEAVQYIPTDKRLEAVKAGTEDNDLIAMYFNFGRYLMISGSRQGTLPLNLQGIWNNEYMPPWDSKYTININIQMNYWPAEVCNLSELHEPLFDLIKRMKVTGAETAERMYNCRGFVAHHNTDIYADTAPQDHYIPATFWVMGAAWFCLHIWEHYEFTQDIDFLRDNFDSIEQAVLFFEDFLIEDGKGHLVTCPSVSPENKYIMPDGESGCLCYASSMDNQIIYALFNVYIKSGRLLGIDENKLGKAVEILEKLPLPAIGKYGQLMEWIEDYEEKEPGHRHISHLFGVYPGNQFTYAFTPELMKAAENSLNRRLAHGGGHTGWSRAWIIDLWARFKNGDKAYENLIELLKNSTFTNLFDNHPSGKGHVFQIDGNFGAIAGIAEMLVQSHEGEIVPLPALPSKIPNGYVKGLVVRGNSEIELRWKDGKIETFNVNNRTKC